MNEGETIEQFRDRVFAALSEQQDVQIRQGLKLKAATLRRMGTMTPDYRPHKNQRAGG